MNELHVIAPFKHHGMWVFDDPKVGLAQEPFVAGADTIIDGMTQNIFACCQRVHDGVCRVRISGR
jgi:hypothetical protein